MVETRKRVEAARDQQSLVSISIAHVNQEKTALIHVEESALEGVKALLCGPRSEPRQGSRCRFGIQLDVQDEDQLRRVTHS